MSAPSITEPAAVVGEKANGYQPYIADKTDLPEFTWSAVLLGSLLGIIFAGSSLYLVLKIGMTVSASIPVAVLAITVFRAFSRAFGLRRASILENNIVQTAGSAGESIAFGVGVTMPALLLLGFDIDLPRVMVVAILGGLLGILAMIPLRRAFIVKMHGRPGQPGTLLYPEGTACAQVLISGEKGGATGKTIFVGFGLAFLFKFITEGMSVLMSTVRWPLKSINRAAVFAGEMAPELLGVGYIIGVRTSAIMMGGAVLGYLVIIPLIAFVGDSLGVPVPPGTTLIKDMSPRELRDNYLLFIGAGCVATAGIISMIRTLPLIIRSIGAGLSGIGAGNGNGAMVIEKRRTENDMSMKVVLFGSLALIALLTLFLMKEVGYVAALAGALLVVLFGFLFVTVSSRLTGEIGSSSNPISGMTVATLTLTCLIFFALGWRSPTERVLALSIAAVVCVASSNGGTTAQSLKTGFLVGGTPKYMQYAILIGAISSALVIGGTLLAFNKAGTVYSEKAENLPKVTLTASEVAQLPATQTYDGETYHVWDTHRGMFDENARVELKNAKAGRYLVDDGGKVRWIEDAAIMGKLSERDDGTPVKREFEAPKTQVMGIIITGVLEGKLNWGLVLIGALIAVTLELCAISSLAFAVGLYVPIQYSTPIFIGGLIRYAVDKYLARREHAAVAGSDDPEARARAEIEAIRKSETSPGVLLAAGFIAGGSLAGMLLAFLAFSDEIPKTLSTWQYSTVPVGKAGPFHDVCQRAAREDLGYPDGALSAKQQANLDEHTRKIEKLNQDALITWAALPAGTDIRLPHYQKYEVTEPATLGVIAEKTLGRKDQAAALLNLNKKQLEIAPSTPAEEVRVPQGMKLTLPVKEIARAKEFTYLSQFAKSWLLDENKAAVLMNLNKDRVQPAKELPEVALLKLPQKEWPALVCFGLLIVLLAAVGMDKVLRVPNQTD